MINDQRTILLCFDANDPRRCRSLVRKNDGELTNINNFSFDNEFDLDTVNIADTNYDHDDTEMANYQGYPMILGGTNNTKLEMLVTSESPVQWNEQTDYPYSDM